MNQQREVIYSYRRKVLKGLNLKVEILEMINDVIANKVQEFIGEIQFEETWPIEDIYKWIENELHIKLREPDISQKIHNQTDLVDYIFKQLKVAYNEKEKGFEKEQRNLERYALLKVVDSEWKDHLYQMDRLKEGIGLRAYGQKDPLIEYKRESFELFMNLVDIIKENVIKNVFTLYPAIYYQVKSEQEDVSLSHTERSAFDHKAAQQQTQANAKPSAEKPEPVTVEKVGRNDPCPCGSGKKYKYCCGRKG